MLKHLAFSDSLVSVEMVNTKSHFSQAPKTSSMASTFDALERFINLSNSLLQAIYKKDSFALHPLSQTVVKGTFLRINFVILTSIDSELANSKFHL